MEKSITEVIKLLNLQMRRDLSADEEDELTNLLAVDEHISNRDENSASDCDSNEEGLGEPNDDSDMDDPATATQFLADPRLVDIAQGLQEAVSNEEEVEVADNVVAADQIIGPVERFVAQNKNNPQVWWSLPSESEKQRTTAAERKRNQYCHPVVTQTFDTKADAFKQLLTPNIIANVVIETNRKARRFYQTCTTPSARKWHDTNEDEVYAYIAVLLYAGSEKASIVPAIDLFHKTNMPFYRATMSLQRFQQLTRFFRFDDSRTRPLRLKDDKLAAFRYVWNLFLDNLQGLYKPSLELTIDEQLVSTRGRCSFRQYIPSKPGKYGLKIFWLVDARTNYPLAGEVYVGTQPSQNRTKHVATDLVLRLSENYLNSGYNITMDNFFTSIELAEELVTKNTTLVGTIRSNKPQLPHSFANADLAKKRGPFSSIFCFSGPICLVSYTSNTKKNVLLLSTAHVTREIDENKQKPKIILDYNKNKGGVDTFDKMVKSYTCKRKINRWPMVLFFNVIDTAALAAYRLFNLTNSSLCQAKIRRRKIFLKELAVELADSHIKNRIEQGNLRESAMTAIKLSGYTVKTVSIYPPIQENNKIAKRCEDCKMNRKGKKGDTKTTAVCDVCIKPTCSKHYIRVCQKCHQTNTEAVTIDEDMEEPNISVIPSTSSDLPPTKRRKTHSPV